MRPVHSTRTSALTAGAVALALAAGLGGAATSAQGEAPAGVRNYTRVDATVACAGATPAEAMPALKELGFASVINFRTAEENGANIEGSRAAAEAAGLKYIHLPFGAPNDDTTEQFLSAVADPSNQPVYIHCASANRVGAMWFIKRVTQDGWDQERAMTEAESIGLSAAGLKEYATAYVNR